MRSLDFGDSVAKDIMIPRADITMAPIDADFEEVLGYFMDEQYSRIPIYEENKENILNILHLIYCKAENTKGNFADSVKLPLG